MVENLPIDTKEEEIREFFKDYKVAQVYMAYNISDYYKL